MNERNPRTRKNKRHLTKPRELEKVGDYKSGKLHYPQSIKSDTVEWNHYSIRKFWIRTHYHSVLTKEKTPIDLAFWLFTDADSLTESIGIGSAELPFFCKEGSLGRFEEEFSYSDRPKHKVEMPRRLLVPHRKTLDNYGLNVTLFQKDNYLGVPICLASRDKKKITESWVYLYNTVLDGVEGIYFEIDSIIPYALYGKVHFF